MRRILTGIPSGTGSKCITRTRQDICWQSHKNSFNSTLKWDQTKHVDSKNVFKFLAFLTGTLLRGALCRGCSQFRPGTKCSVDTK